MKYLSSYKLIKESVTEAKSFWSKCFPNTENMILPYFQKIFHKNPGYIGGFLKLLINDIVNKWDLNDKPDKYETIATADLDQFETDYTDFLENFYIRRIVNCYELIIKHKQLFSQLKLDDYQTIEKLDDYLNNTILINDKNRFVKKFISNKYSHLINDTTIELFDTIRNKTDDYKTIHDLIIRKIASFKTSEEFNDFIRLTIQNTFGDENSVKSLENKCVKEGCTIVYKDDSVLIVDVPSYESMKNVGSPSWCIVRNKTYWDMYVMNNPIRPVKICNQYIIFDTSFDPTDNRSMIGITVAYKGKVIAAHLKNDDPCKDSEYIMYNEYLTGPSLEYFKELYKVKGDLDIIISNDIDDLFEYTYIEKSYQMKQYTLRECVRDKSVRILEKLLSNFTGFERNYILEQTVKAFFKSNSNKNYIPVYHLLFKYIHYTQMMVNDLIRGWFSKSSEEGYQPTIDIFNILISVPNFNINDTNYNITSGINRLLHDAYTQDHLSIIQKLCDIGFDFKQCDLPSRMGTYEIEVRRILIRCKNVQIVMNMKEEQLREEYLPQ